MSSLRQILCSKKVQKFTGSNDALYRMVVAEAEKNVGHGISAEYFNSRFVAFLNISRVFTRPKSL